MLYGFVWFAVKIKYFNWYIFFNETKNKKCFTVCNLAVTLSFHVIIETNIT